MITKCKRHGQADERTCTDCLLELFFQTLRPVRTVTDIMTSGPLNTWRD